MSENTIIEVNRVSKKFCKSLRHSLKYGLVDIGRNVLGLKTASGRLREHEFWALNNLSFTLERGETLGIIGPNGSGKTTLLKLLNGLFMPDKGKVKIQGRVGALIAVGAGFHPLLSGRENIYLNGTILGMTGKEIDEKFNQIVEFADVGDFLEAPVKTYSSGMFVRLGFAIAVHCEPDILLIDEVLSVGDLSFRNKSLRRLNQVRQQAKAVVFVSHNLEHIRTLCDRVLLLDRGRPIFIGQADEAVQRYEALTRDGRLKNLKKIRGLGKYKYYSSGEIEFLEGGIMDQKGKPVDKLSIDDDVITFLRFRVKKPIRAAKIAISILSVKGVQCLWQYSNDQDKDKFYSFKEKEYLLKTRFKKPKLSPGVYTISFSIRDQKSGEIYEKNLGYMPTFRVEGDAFERGVIFTQSQWTLYEKD